MKNSRQQISAAQFKAQCLALLDQVKEHGESIVVTKHGRPVARLVPIEGPPQAALEGSVSVHGDIVGPIDETWDADL